MNKRTGIIIALILGTVLPCLLVATSLNTDMQAQAGNILVQHNGRIKPLEVFAHSTLQAISGKTRWSGQPASTVILEAIYHRDTIGEREWIRIDYPELIAHLNLPAADKYFSYNQLLPSIDRLESLLRSAKTRRDNDERPLKLDGKAESLYTAFDQVSDLISGESLRVLPSPDSGTWKSPYRKPELASLEFTQLMRLINEGQDDAAAQIKQWNKQVAQSVGQNVTKRAGLELHYYKVEPFRMAWILYLLSFVIFILLRKHNAGQLTALALTLAAFLFHTYGIILRIVILARPPVSNMYESMIFMNWVIVLAAFFFSFFGRNTIALLVGSLLSSLVMINAGLLPIDSGMDVLAPVLRSHYWLTVHVLTIVASYAFFALAMGLGHWNVTIEALGRSSFDDSNKSARLIERNLQIGVLLLGIGTVTGGVWANESWGRFWGWDPKETWALITFLGYLAIIHLRHARILKPFDLSLSAILGFMLVVMTWYGVNFLMGKGLHSYGFASGGVLWVLAYTAFELIFSGWAILKKKSTATAA